MEMLTDIPPVPRIGELSPPAWAETRRTGISWEEEPVRQALRNSWTYVVVGLLAFYSLMYLLLELPSDLVETSAVDPLRTLLGGLATGLITAQALVFTISLVAAQLNARYTHRMVSRVFTWPTALYMGLFIGSSIYCTVVLAALSTRSPDFVIRLPWGMKPLHPVAIALALAGTCLALLIPYLWSFKQRLDPERMAREAGWRARCDLQRRLAPEPVGVAALDNITMSAYGYKDYDTFARGVEELAQVGMEAWRRGRSDLGDSVFLRIAHIGVATLDDPRAPSQVVDVLAETGFALADLNMGEATRQVAVAMAGLGEASVERGQASVVQQVFLRLSALGSRAAEGGLIAAAEECVYSLGYLGNKTCQRGLEDATRQVATFLRRVGARAAEHRLDLVTRQATTALWRLGASTLRHLPQCAEVVAGELELLEQMATAALVDASFLSAPYSQELEEFHRYYLKVVRKISPAPSSLPHT